MTSRVLLRRSALVRPLGIALAILLLGVGAAGAGAASSASAAPPASPLQGLNYVALGDSYAAGYGLTPAGGTVPGCLQSSANYPHLLASALGLDLTDVTCSGAVAANILDTPQVTDDGTNPVQSDALSDATDIVTVTIGGNDLGFSNIALNCAAGYAEGPTLYSQVSGTPVPNCKSIYFPDGGADSLSASISTTVMPGVEAALARIRAQAPNAQIFVVAYPTLTPDAAHTPSGTEGCFTPVSVGSTLTIDSYPFTPIDVSYLHDVQAQLDAALSTAASDIGASFVPMFEQTVAYTPCADNADAFIHGITFSLTSGVPLPGGIPAYLELGALHPNAAGAAFIADQVQTAIQAAVAAPSITSGAPSWGVVGVPYTFTVETDGFPRPTFALDSGALPGGLSLDATSGVISGTPTTAGSFDVTLSATSTAGTDTSPVYTIQVSAVPAVTSGVPGDGTVGAPYAFTVTASGYPAPSFAVSSGALPDGLILDATTGAIAGTPTASGPSTFSITATNTAGSATSSSYTIDVVPGVAPTITSGVPPAATVGAAYLFAVTASGTPGLTFAVTSGALPDGLVLNAATGAISGTPTTAGDFAFTITVGNLNSPDTSVSYTLTVAQTRLAVTGSDPAPRGGIALLVLLAGVVALLVSRVRPRMLLPGSR